jgi:hypothetical protein
MFGPNGAGKTTSSAKLAHMYFITYLHFAASRVLISVACTNPLVALSLLLQVRHLSRKFVSSQQMSFVSCTVSPLLQFCSRHVSGCCWTAGEALLTPAVCHFTVVVILTTVFPQDIGPCSKFQCARIQGCFLLHAELAQIVSSSPFFIQTESAGVGKRNALAVAKSGVADALAESKQLWSLSHELLRIILSGFTFRACNRNCRFCRTDAFQFYRHVSNSSPCANIFIHL